MAGFRARASSLVRKATTAASVKRADGSAGKPLLPEGDKKSAKEDSQAPAHTLPSISIDERKVSVGWDGKVWSRYHHLWLRDHCRCSECFHPVTKQRLVDTFSIKADIQPASVKSTSSGLEIVWPSSPSPHVSLYPWAWLHHSSYDPLIATQRSEKVLWGAGIQKDPPTVTYESVMQDDEGLWKWLSKIERFGFCFVTGAPATAADTETLIRRINFLRETHYGGFWEFTSDVAHGDTAYTSMAIGAHTDGTYYTDSVGLQFFHLLSHTGGTGGASLLVDGFYVASLMRELYPSAFNVLTRTPVASHAAGSADIVYRTGTSPRVPGHPIVSVDETGEFRTIRYNNDDRSVLRLPADAVEEWYDALRVWHKTLTTPDSEYWVRLAPGTVLAIDNQRVLHGRSAFTGSRHMCGAYMGMDEFRSRLAVLGERYGTPIASSVDPQPEQANGPESKTTFDARTWGGLI